ncbi:MAG: hypothetical protein QM619_07965 [Micropruina sp.]|uniref:hypothetical protein n=1 Tax=Micropruina sp. TaxID=2737536 RepID=UPI0039E4ED71
MDWWGIAIILVLGIAVVTYGALDDRRKTRERDAAMAAPPKRDIPRFEPSREPPQYLSEGEARTRPAGLPASDLTDQQRADLTKALDAAPSIQAGIPDGRFVTDAASGWAVASDPLVVLCGDPVTTIRELLPVLEKAQRAGRPLALAAPEFGPEVIDTLAANTVRSKEQCIPVVVTANQSAQLAEHTLATPLARGDLQAGWVPEESLGTVATWVSSRDRSWLVHGAQA